jgi:putative aldouronate transport system substrate-binding protein
MILRKRISIVTVLLVCVMGILSACSSSKSSGTDKPTASGSANNSAPNGAAADPMGKYDPPIEITTSRLVDTTFKFVSGDSIDNNT